MGTFVNDLVCYRFKMKYQVTFLLICAIRNSYQRNSKEGVCYNIKGLEECCFNYESIKGICTECKSGTTAKDGGACLPCTENTYGSLCIQKCNCTQFQRCDSEVGCILKTSIVTINLTNTENTEPVSLPNIAVTTKETPVIKSGTSISGWIILTLCVTCCFILTCSGYLIRTYRQRLSFKLRIINDGAILEPLGPAPNIGVYDEIDENPLTFATIDSNESPPEPHYETVDCVSQERIPFTTSTEHGDTGNLDPYFAKEDESDKLQDRTSQTECSSTNSSNSDVVDQYSIANKNVYQPLQENWQDNSHGYKIPVMVHKSFECSTGFDENTISNSYYNVYKPLQKDGDITNPTYEIQKSPETKEGNDKNFLGDACSSEITTGNLHGYINMHAEPKNSMNNCDEMESCKPFDEDLDNVKKIDQQSVSSDF